MSDGQIYVEAPDTDTVTLLLDGVDLTNETEPAIYAQQADKVRIKLVKGSNNQLQSGTSMPDEADENATGGVVFCRDDLVISGSGSLTVNGYINDGIHGNDDLKIKNGTIEVNAIHHAVKANETLSVTGGSLDLTAGTDGIHSEGDVEITDGEIAVSVGDDGIHAETGITIEDGTIEITRSYEGIEANRIYVKGGDISVTSRDDGFNANGGPHHFGMHMEAGTGSEEETETEFPELIIDNGNIYVNADGDGLDSNGDLIVNGGMIVIDGPESSNNGALDSGAENGGSCLVNGGTVLAIGAAGMAERFRSSSDQASFGLSVTTKLDPGTKIVIADENGNELFSHTSAKQFASVVFSCPELEVGEDYVVTIGSKSYDFTLEENSYYYVPSSFEDEAEGSGSPGGRQRDGASGRQRGGSSTTPGEGSATPDDIPSDSPGGGSATPDDVPSDSPGDVPSDSPGGSAGPNL